MIINMNIVYAKCSRECFSLINIADHDQLLGIEEQVEYAAQSNLLRLDRSTTATTTNASEYSDDDDDDDNTSCHSAAAATSTDIPVTECTARMLAAYISEVQNLPDTMHGPTAAAAADNRSVVAPATVDKETNTECAFPHSGRTRSFHPSAHLLGGGGGGGCDTIDERHVKRSQTFSPSAAVAKNRYICRLSRSDSDSAMHFGGGPGTANAIAGGALLASAASVVQHPAFQRGTAERRSLRFHSGSSSVGGTSGGRSSKVAGKSTSKKMIPIIPRTSLDLELDLQAQHSKLETLNDEIKKLKDLKQR